MGEVFEGLRTSGLLDRTLVIVTSDHGESFGEHGVLGHGWCLYDDLLHVPLIVRLPGVVPEGVTEDALVENRLLWPMIDAVRESWRGDRSISRESMVTALHEEETPENTVFFEYRKWKTAEEQRRQEIRDRRRGTSQRIKKSLRSIQVGSLKYLCSPDGEEELYDLEKDPEETQNLAAEQPELARMLREQVMTHFDSREIEELEDSPRLCVELIEELKGLGYLR